MAEPLSGLPDRFRIDREIGRGGMSVVFRAHDTQLNRSVAIKVLSEAFSNAVGIERFEREIAVMAKLAHPGIVSLFDSGAASGRLYYVMPLVPGECLRGLLRREGRLTQEAAVAIAADVADALAFAHHAGVVHRDVKPENIFVVSGRAMLADFGIAHVAGAPAISDADETMASPGSLTSAGTILGTLAYLSPEQASGRSTLDGRSDLYSLGCVLYELLAGEPPFAGATIAVIGQHLTGTPVPLSERGVPVSPALAHLIDRMLAKNPADRPADAATVATTLRNLPAHNAASTAPLSDLAESDRLVEAGTKEFMSGTVGGPASRNHMDRAGVYLRRAVAAAPRNARALIMLGNWHFVMARLGFVPNAEALEKGRELTLAALDADDRIAEVHASLAKASLYYDDDMHSALRHAQRAVELGPDDAEALRTLSVILKVLGRTDEAIAVAEKAVAAAPQLMNALGALADALRVAERFTDEIEVLRRALKIVPAHSQTLERLEWAFVALGDVEQAVDYRTLRLRQTGQTERAERLQQNADTIGPLEARRRDLAEDVERLLARTATEPPFSDTPTTNSIGDRIALGYSELGDWPNATVWIERAYTHRPGRLQRMLRDLPFDVRGLATQPRFVRLLRLAGVDDLIISDT